MFYFNARIKSRVKAVSGFRYALKKPVKSNNETNAILRLTLILVRVLISIKVNIKIT